MTDMLPQVWVSSGTNDGLRLGEDGVPVGWQAVGTIDTTRETKLWKIVQGHLGLRGSSEPRSVDFYLDGDPASGWVQQAKPGDKQGFMLAIDLTPAYRRFLVTTRPAHFAHPATREPEAHPALARPQFVGIRLRSGANGLFQRVDS